MIQDQGQDIQESGIFRKNIRKYREERGETLEAFSGKIGITPEQLSMLEDPESKPSGIETFRTVARSIDTNLFDLLFRIADALAIPLLTIYEGDECHAIMSDLLQRDREQLLRVADIEAKYGPLAAQVMIMKAFFGIDDSHL